MWLVDQLAEQHIKAALDKGELSQLPGEGKPLQLDDDSHVPPELRAGYRLLKNAGFLPPELELRREAIAVNDLIRQLDPGDPRYQDHCRRLKFLELRLQQAGMRTDFLHGDYADAIQQRFSQEKQMYRIGQLAKLADVTPDTIRFYEKQQMMDHGGRTEGGFRLYGENDLQRLKFIRYGRKLGFSLEAIRELLSIRVDPAHHTCQESKSIVEKRLGEVAEMIAELESMQRSLQHLSDACCGDTHSSVSCSILEALERGERISR